MSSAPVVSVVMSFLNAERFMEEAIESVFAQTYPHWELLLVDDGSTDGSSAMARSYAARHPGKVSYLEHPGHRNRGTSASRNLGIANAGGNYVAFLDADDVYLPDRLERHVSLLETMPEVDMVQSDALRWYSWSGATLRDVRGRCPSQVNTVLRPPSMLRQSLYDDPLRGWFPCVCSATLRRSAVTGAKGFQEEFFDLCEDWVFFTKVYVHRNVYVTDDVVAKYRKHPGSTLHRALADRKSLLGRRYDAHVAYLRWLKTYLERNDGDRALIRLLRRKLWPEGHPLFSRYLGIPPAAGLAWNMGRRRIVWFLLSASAYERQRRWRHAVRARGRGFAARLGIASSWSSTIIEP